MKQPNVYATIHGLTRTLGLSDEDYRDMLWKNYGVRSSKELNIAKVQNLIASLRNQVRTLEDRSPAAGQGWKKYEDLGNRPGMATPPQLRKIEAMWWGVSKLQPLDRPAGLARWLKNRFNINGVLWIEGKAVQKLIRALEEMVKQKEEEEARAASRARARALGYKPTHHPTCPYASREAAQGDASLTCNCDESYLPDIPAGEGGAA